jgi:hypothetical protein
MLIDTPLPHLDSIEHRALHSFPGSMTLFLPFQPSWASTATCHRGSRQIPAICIWTWKGSLTSTLMKSIWPNGNANFQPVNREVGMRCVAKPTPRLAASAGDQQWIEVSQHQTDSPRSRSSTLSRHQAIRQSLTSIVRGPSAIRIL